MTSGSRFQRRTAYAVQGEVDTWTGVDAITGLPVLVYGFPGRPRREVERLESEHVPGVLAMAFDGARGEVVTAFSADYRPLRPDHVDDAIIAAGAAALRDAARAGVVHGDLRPGRFLVAGGHLLVEGYGVPWSPGDARLPAPEGSGTLPGDVYAFAASFLDLGHDRIGAETVALLVEATSDEPAARPSAERLAAALASVVAAAQPRRTPVVDPEPMVLDTDPGGPPIRTSKAPGGGVFSKEPPPGTRYRPGEDADAPPPGRFKFPSLHDGRILGTGSRRWYRFAALGATLLATAVLALLALSRQEDRFGDPTDVQPMMYVVEVSVEPPNLPPVTLFVVAAPDTSRWRPGTALATVPGRVVLDQAGVWRLQGRFQDRRSQVVTLQVPAERTATLVFAQAAADAP